MREINLLHGSEPTHRKIQNIELPKVPGRGLLWFLVGLLALELAVFGIVFGLRSAIEKDAMQADSQIATVMSDIEAKKDDLNLAVADQFLLKTFSDQLEKHPRWTKVLGELSDVTLKIARYNALQAEASDSEFVIGGVVQTFQDLGKVILGLETSGEFEKVTLLDTTINDQGGQVIFEILVDVKSDLLANTEATDAFSPPPSSQSQPLQ